MKRFFKRRKQERAVREHLAAHGGDFSYQGLRLSVPDTVELGVRYALATGNYETSEMVLAERFLAKSLPVIELGGCLGVVSAKLRSLIDANAALYVVEANPHLLSTVQTNATRPAPEAVTEVISAAVYYDADRAPFHFGGNVHVGRVARPGDVSQGVPATTLSGVVARLGKEQAYSLVCDIEGAEYDVFARDGAALARCQVAIVEIHPAEFSARGRTVEAFLDSVASAGLVHAATDGSVSAFVRPS